MGKIILVTGGSRSGKSTFAENIFKNTDDVLYIATAIVTDEEMSDRIRKHIDSRNSRWTTFEGYYDLDKAIEKYDISNILLDCVTIMITNLMFKEKIDFDKISMAKVDELLDDIKTQFEKLISKARVANINLVMVTNEVGSGLVPENKLSRVFRDIAGFVNQYIASQSDEVYLVSCGLPLKLK
ncbi:bifunctional adenosylcobinamide kinase/adenosylcobinamide-phosphate guanylyltransferase [Clostridium estertheticum]|uniref:bifunctional adenosylcobinamide kinase/adenosylcobinamide-phosphate guanylyltransferase n=1 Tax=Clostridium estertheticum TaxID=238834 RepID=UPI001C6E38B3|nr:bifunctional adenosylcobinamide kinase/adenosylcobinamide-phosphate guanylyltransferase [Clostridium estertheticum]MBW9172888.1 bifunctional adenosylcobinamide kinase/adenosylcobinamide-phosphate guanylyltransferase [Clostridium estertheticum]WLC75271.1 bifunctional adenosylcobinamide kinase/adenosylcobinamide-phosphate guanylyltransferase [Clostridium estertheticum]